MLVAVVVDDARATVTSLVVTQAIATEGGRFSAAQSVDVSYTTTAAGPVKIGVYTDRPVGIGQRWYADERTEAALFEVQASAGAQTLSFKLSDLKIPAKPLPTPLMNANMEVVSADLNKPLPGIYVVEVRDSDSHQHTSITLQAAGESMIVSRTVPGFSIGAVRDHQNNIIVANRQTWTGQKFSPNWMPLTAYPQAGVGHSSNPVECYDVAVDSHDNAYVMTRNGLYKFSADGQPSAFSAEVDYTNYPYPSEVKNLLGVRLGDIKGDANLTFGPGGGGRSKKYSSEQMGQPGITRDWAAVAIDASDQIFLSTNISPGQVQVFDHAGQHLRSLAAPEGAIVMAMRFSSDGKLWAVDGARLLAMDVTTGQVTKTVANVSGRVLHLGPDGTIYVLGGATVWRFNSDGEPVNFAADAPGAQDGGRFINLSPDANKVAPGTAGYTTVASGIVGEADGGFALITRDSQDPNSTVQQRVMRFDRAGRFLIDSPAARVLPWETGNIFVGDQPAGVVLQLANFTAASAALQIKSVIKNLKGETLAEHEETRTAAPMTLVSNFLSLGDARAMGYYTIDIDVRADTTSLLSQRLYGGRVVGRGNTFAPYSPFGSVRMEVNPELVRRMGGGLNRNHNPLYWDHVEPTPGQWNLQPPDTLNFFRERGMGAMVILGYGEPWFQGGFSRCRITRYDDFFNYVATVIGQYKGTANMWQCWNEPNFFWHVPGKYQYEQYAQVLQATYAIAKAIDPNADAIADGFAASASMFGTLGDQGASGFTDAVPIHYPGVKTITFDNMPLEGAVETKAAMVHELRAIRDAKFPGKPLINTEEGIWGMQKRTPEDGAKTLARIYVSQLAAGLDRLTWFECYSAEDPGYLLRGMQEGPWPAYFAYATTSAMLEDAMYVAALADDRNQIHVFNKGGRPVIVAWCMDGEQEVSIDVSAPEVVVADWEGNTRKVVSDNGTINLLTNQYAQFVTGAGDTLLPRLAAAGKGGHPIDWSSDQPMDLTRLFYAARQAEIQAHLPVAAAADVTCEQAANELKAAEARLTASMSDGRYLRNAYTARSIARRTNYFMNHALSSGNAAYAQRLASAVIGLSHQIDAHAKADTVWYPGVMIRAALDTSKVRQEIEPQIAAAFEEVNHRKARREMWLRLRQEERTNPAKTPDREVAERLVNEDNAHPIQPPALDERFDPQVEKKPGEAVELEITLYNWRAEKIAGVLHPTVPAGWVVELTDLAYEVEPQKFARHVVRISIPHDAAPGTYSLGATTIFKESEQRELHPQRMVVR